MTGPVEGSDAPESGERYRWVVEALDSGVTVVTADLSVAMANEALGATLCCDPSAVVGEHVSVLAEETPLRAVDLAALTSAVDRVAEGDATSLSTEATLAPHDGEPFVVEMVVRTLPDGAPDRDVLVLFERLDDRTETAEELRRDHQLRAIVENTSEAIYIKDVHGRYLMINAAGAEMFGMEPGSVIGKHDADLFEGAEDVDQIRAMDERVMDEREPVRFERDRTIDGERRVFVNEKFPYVSKTGELLGVMGISRDITESRERQRELERQNERLDEFASIISHDLRNPLTVARGALELAREEGDDEHFERLERALSGMDDLIDDLLSLARQGRVVGETEPVDLATVATEAWAVVRTPEASLDLEAGLCTVQADRDRLSELLENVFRNAVEHGGGDVTVRVRDTEDGFCVEDDGRGIPADVREEVFEAGYTTSEGGTGLGLAIVRRIASALDWSVAVEDGPDGGTCLRVRTEG